MYNYDPDLVQKPLVPMWYQAEPWNKGKDSFPSAALFREEIIWEKDVSKHSIGSGIRMSKPINHKLAVCNNTQHGSQGPQRQSRPHKAKRKPATSFHLSAKCITVLVPRNEGQRSVADYIAS